MQSYSLDEAVEKSCFGLGVGFFSVISRTSISPEIGYLSTINEGSLRIFLSKKID